MVPSKWCMVLTDTPWQAHLWTFHYNVRTHSDKLCAVEGLRMRLIIIYCQNVWSIILRFSPIWLRPWNVSTTLCEFVNATRSWSQNNTSTCTCTGSPSDNYVQCSVSDHQHTLGSVCQHFLPTGANPLPKLAHCIPTDDLRLCPTSQPNPTLD